MEIQTDLFDFVWHRCPDGYVFVEADEVPAGASLSDYKWDHVAHPTISAISKRIVRYHPIEEAPNLHQTLAEMKGGKTAALEFAHRYGLLTGEVEKPGASMEVKTYDTVRKRIKNVRKVLETGLGEAVATFQNEYPFSSHNFHLSLRLDKNNNPIVHMVPGGMQSFLMLRLATEVSGGVEWRKCAAPGCENLIPISHGRGALTQKFTSTSRRKTCSETCRKRHNRALNKSRKESSNGQSS